MCQYNSIIFLNQSAKVPPPPVADILFHKTAVSVHNIQNNIKPISIINFRVGTDAPGVGGFNKGQSEPEEKIDSLGGRYSRKID